MTNSILICAFLLYGIEAIIGWLMWLSDSRYGKESFWAYQIVWFISTTIGFVLFAFVMTVLYLFGFMPS